MSATTRRTKIDWRVKGGRKSANVIDISRATGIAPIGWGNPYTVECNGREAAVSKFRDMVASNPAMQDRVRSELRGKTLACYCEPDEQCHGDVLVEYAEKEL